MSDFTSFGRNTSELYVGRCVYDDAMSFYIQVELQLGFSSAETILVKQTFEQLILEHVVTVKDYLVNNGIFNNAYSIDKRQISETVALHSQYTPHEYNSRTHYIYAF